MMRSHVILLVSFFCLVSVQGTRRDAEKDEAVQNIVDTVITSLVESGDEKTLSQLYEALQDDEGVDKRDQTINNGKLGHCCQAGKLAVSYHNKETTVVKTGSTKHDHSSSRKCGTFGWRRCHNNWSTYSIYYHTAKVMLKIPVYSCGIEHAVCCAGYVSLPNLPGGLAKVSENSCIKSEKAAYVIKQLQLIEDVAGGKKEVTPDQMDSIFKAVAQFFKENGIQQQSK